MNSYYVLSIAGVKLHCTFGSTDTHRYFGAFCDGPFEGKGDVMLSESFWDAWVTNIGPRNSYNEYSAFSSAVSSALLQYNRCLIHAAAVRWNDKSWLICGKSGVGKSTQVRTLQNLYPDEFTVICGDRPALSLNDDGTVTVYPAPWNGKENWYGAEAAELAGIIYLRRGSENRIEPLSPAKAAVPVYTSLIQIADSEQEIRKVAKFAESLIERVPVWNMTNLDIPESTQMLYETVFCGGNRNEL